jgi:hypothetical protein
MAGVANLAASRIQMVWLIWLDNSRLPARGGSRLSRAAGSGDHPSGRDLVLAGVEVVNPDGTAKAVR